jgi:hypothetical protein
MSHSHDHSHDHSGYYLEQLCTIVVCGALGLVVILLYFQRTLDHQKALGFLLADFLHPYLLGSGIAILAVAALRAGFLFLSLRRRAATQHADDDHCKNCGHHHDHDHRWSPLRYLALCLPIMLFLLGLPNEGFRSVKAVEIEVADRPLIDKQGDVIYLDFLELYNSAYNPAKREYLEGRTGTLKGQLVMENTGRHTSLVRFKSTCCPADAIPLYVAFVSPESIADLKPMSWVQVTGQIQYGKRKGLNQSIPVLKVRSRQDITPTTSEYPYYLE